MKFEDYPPGFIEYVQPLLNARQRALQQMTSEEKLICKHILESFPLLGRGPNVAEIVSGTGLPRVKVVESLRRLNAIDMLKYESQTGRVLVLYPISDIPCPHRVYLQDKRPLYAM